MLHSIKSDWFDVCTGRYCALKVYSHTLALWFDIMFIKSHKGIVHNWYKPHLLHTHTEVSHCGSNQGPSAYEPGPDWLFSFTA